MANHLETLIWQYYDWQNWIVRTNIKVGRLKRGGYAGELDVVAYDARSKQVLHFEPSLDADTWSERERRYKKKFEIGRKHINKEEFPWLPSDFRLCQIAIFNNVPPHRKNFVGAKSIGIDALIKDMKEKIAKESYVGVKAIPQNYDLLRTIQLVVCGYYADPE